MENLTLLSDPNTLVLTPGSGVSRLLLEQLIVSEKVSGRAVWQRPLIYSVNSWLKMLWQQIPLISDFNKPVLLSSVQERAVWQSIIAESKWSNVLMQVSSLARNAQQAHRLMVEWRISNSQLTGFKSDESRALRSWKKLFAERCKDNHWVEECCLADRLIDLPAGLVDWPEEIVTYGLNSQTPQQRDFLAFLSQQGCKISELDSADINESTVRIGLADQNLEVTQAANWAKSLLQEEPSSRIAIALVDYSRQVDSLSRALDRVLSPECLYPSIESNAAYTDSQKPSLTVQPLVECALRVLSLSRHRVELSEFSLLLRSIHLAGAKEEYGERSRLDAHLRSLGELTPSLVYICSQIFNKETQQYKFDCPELSKRLHAWRKQIDALPKVQSASAWAVSFTQLLGAIGWSVGLTTSVFENEIVDKWDDVLSRLCSLDAMTSPLRLDEALLWLRALATNAAAPVADKITPIQLTAIEDAALLEFDHLWVCGLDDNQWPPAVRPNPLLPVALQREHGLPGASSSDVAMRAGQIVDGLLRHSRNVVLSYAVAEDDREQRVSPLIETIKNITSNSLVMNPDPATKIFDSRSHETIDEQTLPMQGDAASGGTSIIKNQAACPFRAYVTHRLRADVPEEPEAGLDASERGTLMHDVLEIVWSKLISHSALVDAGEAERKRIVSDAASQALEKMIWKKPETITPKFREIELERLEARVMAWLYFEEQRESFTVLKPEAERTLELSGLKMEMRIDRIDQNALGERIIIDYKTGKTSPVSWFGSRPDEPQLPLYALSEIESGNSVAAVSFAQIRPGEYAFKGIGNTENVLPGVKGIEKHTQGKHYEDWGALIGEWRSTLGAVAADFVAGIATVDPKKSSSCQYCELPGVCRINELNQRRGVAEFKDSDDD